MLSDSSPRGSVWANTAELSPDTAQSPKESGSRTIDLLASRIPITSLQVRLEWNTISIL